MSLRNLVRGTWAGYAVVLAFVLTGLSMGQDSGPTVTKRLGIPEDWSHRHVIFTKGASAEAAAQSQRDPRNWLQWARRTQATSRAAGRPPLGENPDRGRRPRNKGSSIDWTMSLGSTAGVAQLMSPAKFSFDVNAAPSCAGDFVVFPVNASPSTATQANIVAFNNLYTGTTSSSCPSGASQTPPTTNSTTPSFLWSYAVINSSVGPAGVATSPSLSLDGAKVAFVDSNAQFYVLTWSAEQGTDATHPVAPGSGSSVAILDYTAVGSAGCSSSRATNNLSPPFVDYDDDVAYVGDDKGRLYKITGVFNSPPTLAYCTTVSSGALTAPVFDSVSGKVFVSDGATVFAFTPGASSFTAAGSVQIGSSTCPACSITDSPIVDSTNGFVYVFSAANVAGTNAVVSQIKESDLTHIETPVGVAATPFVPIGAFDNAYYSSGPASGTLYVCGTHGAGSGSPATSNLPSLYAIGFNTDQTMETTPIMSDDTNVNPGITPGTCSLTEFFDGTNDRLFVGVGYPGNATIGANVVTMWDINTAITANTALPLATATNQLGGASGMVVDNASTEAQADSIYLGTLATSTSASCGSDNYCAVKLAQSDLLTDHLVSITVTPANPSIAQGTSQQFTATGTYSDGGTLNLTNSATWTSTNTATATITSGGLATGIATGPTTIQATLGSITGSTGLTITPAVLVSIAVTPVNASISITTVTTEQFTATGTFSDGSQQNLTASATWTSSNTAIAPINSAGVATGVGIGSTTIQATSGAISGSTTLTVTSTIPGLVGWWKFNDGSGTTAVDSSGNGYNATLFDGVSWVAGNIWDYAVSANGVNQYVGIPAVNLSTTNAVTVTLWVNRTYSTAGDTLFEATTDYNNSTTGFGFFPDDTSSCGAGGGIEVGLLGNVGYTATCYSQPSSGVWHHFAVIYDKSQAGSNEVSLYLDGVLQTATRNVYASTNTNDFGDNPIYLFSRGGTEQYSAGIVDDLRIYNQALSASQIQQIYEAGSISVTPVNPSIAQGTTLQFTATETSSGGGTVNLTSGVTWTSSNTAVATINSAGLATGVGVGSTTIHATYGSIQGSTELTVAPIGQFVQWSSGDSGKASVSTTYLPTNVTTGDLLLVFSKWDNQTLTASVTDNAGNTYVPISGPINLGAAVRVQAWYAKNVVGGSIGVTVTYSGTTTSTSLLDAAEYSGLDTSAPLDVFATATGTGVSQDSGPSPATTASYETIVGLFGYYAPASPFTAGTGFTIRNYDSSSMLEDQPVYANGSYHATATSEGSTSWAAYVICFKNAFQGPLSLTLNPSTVTGGNPVAGTVTLPAPGGGASITLSSSNPAVATVPANVVVSGGATSAPFTVSTSSVNFTTAVTISGTYNGTTQNATLTVVPVTMSQVASDNFNRSNAPTLGPNWTPLVGANDVALQIVGTQVESTALTPSVGKEMYYGGLTWSADQYSQAQIVAANGNGYEGPAVRMTSNDTHYACVVLNTGSGNATVEILLDNAGTYTVLASSTSSTVQVGDNVRCTVQGNVLKMTDQTTSATLLTATDNTIPSGYPGLVDAAGTTAVTNYIMANWSAGASLAPMSLQQLASDNFNRPNALNLGTNWAVGPGHGPIQIVNDQVQPYPAGGPQPSKEHYVAAGVFPNDQWSQIQVIVEDVLGDNAVEVRGSDTSDTMYVLDVNLTGAPGVAETRIVNVINGVITPLVIDQTWSAVSPGDYICGQVQGNLLSLIDVTTGTLLLSAFDTNITSGYAGISMQAIDGNPADHIGANWSGGTFH